MRLSTSTRNLFHYLATGSITDAWSVYEGSASPSDFAEAVSSLTGEDAGTCDKCNTPQWDDELIETGDGKSVCSHCCSSYYSQCSSCENYINDIYIYTVDGRAYCDSCRDCHCTYCQDCDEWYRDENADAHRHDCTCEAPIQRFRFPANGEGFIANDERLSVKLAAGVIDDQGIYKIINAISRTWTQDEYALCGYGQLLEIPDEIGPEWQTKKGNFTKRISKVLAAKGIKLSNTLVSEIGNIARAHSSTETEWWIEFTRDLNLPADYFSNEESCWWGSYFASRCALKNWGGIGMRSYQDSEIANYHPSGRAWVQPLNDGLNPTHNAENAFAYVIYNGYGNLEDFIPARIIAHLTGRSYRKIGFTADPVYVNSGGYLVAAQDVCDDIDSITFTKDVHNQMDARELLRTGMVR